MGNCVKAALRLALCALLLCVVLGGASAESPSGQFDSRWILVDLGTLQAIAFEGATPTYIAPVTSGKPGWETPTGAFRIGTRIASDIMSSETMGIPRNEQDGYYLTDVLYAQYFLGGGYAIHGNYWQPDWVFGTVNTSHGCIGMRNQDAGYFWEFAGYGTPIVITYEPAAYVDYAGVAALTSSALETVPGPPVPEIRQPDHGSAWVPDLVGLPEAAARDALQRAGLQSSYANYQTMDDLPSELYTFFMSIEPGAVLSSTPSAGQQVAEGSIVYLAVRRP